jgi:hypothetical protein
VEKKKQDSVSFVKEKAEEATNWQIIRQVQINRSFYNSQQWIGYDKTQHRIYVPELRPGEKRLTFNKIKPSILTLLSKLCKNRVKLEVKPDTNDTDRIEVAKAGHKYLGYQWDDNHMDTLTRRLKFHMLLDGFPALKVYVDKTQGKDIDVSEMEDAEPMKTGKIITQVKDQLSLKVDPSVEAPEDIKWSIEETPTDVDEIKETWGVEVTPESNISIVQTFESVSSPTDKKKYKNHAMVYDYWELPCAKYPKGRRIVVAGDKELLKTDKPGLNPYIFFPAIPIPGCAVATGIVTDMTTPQKSYNIKRTAEARILEEMGNPMWLKPEGSVDDDELTNEIGGIVHYNPINSMKPERVQGSSVDAGWQNAMERDEADIEDISGAHEISQGATPKGNNTLGGLQLQVEQDETKLALLVQSYEDGIKIWGEKVLQLIKEHFPEEQQLSIVGENGQIEAFTFSGSDLTGGEVVDVVPGSSMPTLKAVQDEKIMAMWGAGMFNDPATGLPDSRKVVRMLGESIAVEYFDDTEQDRNKALMENRTFMKLFEDEQAVQLLGQYQQQMQAYQATAQQAAAQGIDFTQAVPPPQSPVPLPPVRDFYDHETHIQVHNRFRKTQEYDELSPELQAIIDQHVDEHEQALMAPQIAQQQAEMASQQQQAEQQSAEADKDRQFQSATKMQDHFNNMEREGMKGQMQMQAAQTKSGIA